MNENSILHRAILTHVDDFNITGPPELIRKVIDYVAQELTVSKIKEDTFRFTGLDVKVMNNSIEVSKEDYKNSLKEIQHIRKVEDRLEPLSKLEMKEYWKMTSKIAWLANSTRLIFHILLFRCLIRIKKQQSLISKTSTKS